MTSHSQVIGLAADPIEKKPLYHFYPGSRILSFGTAGCNLGCKFCQNWDMSKAQDVEYCSVEASPAQIVALALKHKCPSIAYTYNEPIIFAEFMNDVAELAHENGLQNVMVTNGYVTPEARAEVFRHTDAANVDLKAFSERFYFKLTAAHLEHVLDTIKWLVNESDVWVELTTLLIPGWNDSVAEIEDMARWVLDKCGADVPLHFSAFHPAYRMEDIDATPPDTVINARRIAMKAGLHYVYTGNIIDDEGSKTYCPACGKALVERGWSSTQSNGIKHGKCECGQVVKGVW